MSAPERLMTVCYQHPDRIAGATCGRCRRPICPECMSEGPRGWECRQCLPLDAGSSQPKRWRPSPTAALGQSRMTPAVSTLIALNVVIYLATVSRQADIDLRFSMIPAYVRQGDWYRLITSAFLHVSVEHIFFNMATLAIIGPAVENSVGRLRFLTLYVLAAFGGSIASYLVGPYLTESLGASGAIFGVMGAYYVLARRSGTDTRTVLALIVVNLIFGFAEAGIDWRDHLGGLFVGALAAYCFARAADLGPRASRLGAWVSVGAIAGVLALVAQLPPGQVTL